MGGGISKEKAEAMINEMRAQMDDKINSNSNHWKSRMEAQIARIESQYKASQDATKDDIKSMIKEMQEMRMMVDEEEKKKREEKEKQDDDKYNELKNMLDQIKEKLADPPKPADPYSLPPGMYPPWYHPWYPPHAYGPGPSHNSPGSCCSNSSFQPRNYDPWNELTYPGSSASSTVPPNSPGFHPNLQSVSFYNDLNRMKAPFQDSEVQIARGVKDFFLKTNPRSNTVNDGDEHDASSTYSYSIISSASAANGNEKQYEKQREEHYPSEEVAVRENLDLSEPLPKKILFLGKDENNEWIMHEPKCLKDVYSLEKKYEVFRIIDLSKET